MAVLTPPAAVRAQSLQPDSPWNHPLSWAAVGGALAASFLMDGAAHEEMSLEGGDDARGLAEVGNALATPSVLAPAIGGAYLAGRLFDRPGLSRGAVHAVLGLAASSAATSVLKTVVGRPRPYLGTDGDELRPFAFDGAHHSFPSGHATVSFSVATTIAVETGNPWLASMAYGAAGVDAWARVHDDRHWLSDVVGGAIVGTLTTRMALSRLHAGREASSADAPRLDIGPGGVELTLKVR